MHASRYCKYCQMDHVLTSEFWYRLESSPRCKEQVKAKRRDNYDPVRAKKYNKEYFKVNRDTNILRCKEWRESNSSQHKQNALNWYYANKERAVKKQRAYKANRRKTDPSFKLACNLRSRMNNVLQGRTKVGSAIKDLGCTTKELVVYLESKFSSEMNWDNYGTCWEVDHIKPLANYDLTDREIYCKLAHHTNLQPMLIEENRRKSNK